MAEAADLEIGIHRRDEDRYVVEMRFQQPDSETDTRLLKETPSLRFDFEKLLVAAPDHRQYGRLLADMLFGDPEVEGAFLAARRSAQSRDVPLRLRLFVGPSAPELHRLRWETLCDPESGEPLTTGEQVHFSRYLTSFDWRPVRLRARSSLRVLVAVADPDLTDYPGLAPVDVEGELGRARASMSTSPDTLTAPGTATLNALSGKLREGCDVLYLVCHGTRKEGESTLWLEDESGQVARTAAKDLVSRFRELQTMPRLVVLAACQSSDSDDGLQSADDGALASLGPLLAAAGVPAVIAMQGNVTMKTVGEFMTVFFRELERDGQIDRAVALARGAVRERPDFWMPTLFMRLKSGRIWYQPGFGEGEEDFKKWKSIESAVKDGRFTPIIGWGLNEDICGNATEAAQALADRHGFPLEPYLRRELTKVAQYLRVDQDEAFVHREIAKQMRRQVLARHRDELDEECLRLDVPTLLRTVGAKQRASNPEDPYRLLAGLPAKVFITRNPDHLLRDALTEAGREPDLFICDWRDSIDAETYENEPRQERPLVFYMLGSFEDENSLVVTEDDYFDYLIGATENRDLVPEIVRHTTASSALMFLGFRLNEWSFRVLFRIIMRQEGGSRRKKFSHVAVQIDPEEHTFIDVDRARRYLKSYFHESANISIFWGSAADFLSELTRRIEMAETDGVS